MNFFSWSKKHDYAFRRVPQRKKAHWKGKTNSPYKGGFNYEAYAKNKHFGHYEYGLFHTPKEAKEWLNKF